MPTPAHGTIYLPPFIKGSFAESAEETAGRAGLRAEAVQAFSAQKELQWYRRPLG